MDRRIITGAVCALAIACAAKTETESTVQPARTSITEDAPAEITELIGVTSYEFTLDTSGPAIDVRLVSNAGPAKQLVIRPFFNGGVSFLLGSTELDVFDQSAIVRENGTPIMRVSPDARALLALSTYGQLEHGTAALATLLSTPSLKLADDNPTATTQPTWMDVACQNEKTATGLATTAITVTCGSCLATLKLGDGATMAQFILALASCPACVGATYYSLQALVHCWNAFAAAKTDAACALACSTWHDFPGASGKWNGLTRGCECACNDKLCAAQMSQNPAVQYCGAAECRSNAPDACKVPASQTCGDGRRDAKPGCTPEVCDSFDGCDKYTACNATCSECVPKGPKCGNGALDVGEPCDGALGCGVGEKCDPSCTVCAKSQCGNNKIDAGEVCDGALGCTGRTFCRVDCSECASLCGNSYVDPGEACDGVRGCTGNDHCADDCGSCVAPRCGDGNVDPGEACDFGGCGPKQHCRADCGACVDDLPDDCRIIINFVHPERKDERVALFTGGTCTERDAGTKAMVLVGVFRPNNPVVTTSQCGIYGLHYYIETPEHVTKDPGSPFFCIDVPMQTVNSQAVTVTD